MTIAADIREQVRQRANFACEFCGVTETDTGSQLTIDHFQPKTKGGDDSLDNLVYCCYRCNQYKLDYWPAQAKEPTLWNPRQEPASQHFLRLDDGKLYALTTTASFTLKRLRLNRAPLVALRLQRQQQANEVRLLTHYQELLQIQTQINKQISTLMKEQQKLLREQQNLLRLLLGKKND